MHLKHQYTADLDYACTSYYVIKIGWNAGCSFQSGLQEFEFDVRDVFPCRRVKAKSITFRSRSSLTHYVATLQRG